MLGFSTVKRSEEGLDSVSRSISVARKKVNTSFGDERLVDYRRSGRRSEKVHVDVLNSSKVSSKVSHPTSNKTNSIPLRSTTPTRFVHRSARAWAAYSRTEESSSCVSRSTSRANIVNSGEGAMGVVPTDGERVGVGTTKSETS